MFFIILCVLLVFVLILFKFKSKKYKNINGRHVVVTGGTSGIGLHIAIGCVLKGAHVTVIARNVQMLEKTVKLLESKRINSEQKISYKSLDVSKSYDDVCNALNEIEKNYGQIYMLVNCAGLAICGCIEDISINDAKHLMDVNYFGTYYCIRYVLPKMKNSGDGIIVMTASQAALFGIYGYGPYAAAKFALRGLAETLSMECKHKGISITLALPCDTDTPGFENEEKTKPKETKIISGSGGLVDPGIMGKQILNDALKGSFFSIMGFESWIITLLCCGMAPWGDIGLNLLQALLMGPLRLLGIGLQWHFSRIIERCAKEKKNMGTQVNLCNCEASILYDTNENNTICICESTENKKGYNEKLNNKKITSTSKVMMLLNNESKKIVTDKLITNNNTKNLNGNFIEKNAGKDLSMITSNLNEHEFENNDDDFDLKDIEDDNDIVDDSLNGIVDYYSPRDGTIINCENIKYPSPNIRIQSSNNNNDLIIQKSPNDSEIRCLSPINEDLHLNSVDYNKKNLNINEKSKSAVCNLENHLNNQITPLSIGYDDLNSKYNDTNNGRPMLRAKRRIQKT